MIQSTKSLIYDARNGNKQAIIQVEITSYVTNKDTVTYTVNDFAVDDLGAKQLINTKETSYTSVQINEMEALICSSANFVGLTRTQSEWLKVKLALLFVTKMNPIYGSTANDWELVP